MPNLSLSVRKGLDRIEVGKELVSTENSSFLFRVTLIALLDLFVHPYQFTSFI